jgi:predicted dehydrogenase
MKQFRIAMIGCGGVSQMHFDGYVTHPDRLQIVAACDLDPARVQQAQQKYGFAQAFTSLEEMIEEADWEVGVVCTPTPVRLQVVKTLAAAGKHILVEKPFADTYEEAAEMVRICEEAGVTLAVDQNFRYHFPYRHARQLVEEGLIGKVTNLIHQDLMFRQDQGWRTQTKRHAMSVMGVHWFDGFRLIVQDEPESIFCLTQSSPAIDCAGETEAFTQLRFRNGVTVSYVESFSTPRRRAETVIVGEQGSLVLDYDGISLYTKENRNAAKQTWENPYRGAAKPESAFACLNELLTALEEECEPSNSGLDNLKTIELLDAAYRSAEEGRPVLFRQEVLA